MAKNGLLRARLVMSDTISLNDSNAAVIEPEGDEPTYDGPCCSECEAPMDANQMVCRSCGYYPSLGVTVDLDAEWEAAVNDAAAEPEELKTAMEEFIAAIPAWAWSVIGTNVGVLAVSIVGRLLLPPDAILFTYWGTIQLIAGLALAVMLHITCFIIIASSDTDIGVTDVVVSPLKAWMRVIQRMPKRLWLLIGETNGITLALSAALIIGGIPWDRLWDWGIEAPTSSKLVDTLTSAAGGGSGTESLEEAIADFAGQAMPGEDSTDKPKKPEEPKPRIKTDCLIIGFKVDEADQLTEVLIATETTGRLVYAGKLVPELEPAEKLELQQKLMQSRTGSPLVKTGQVAIWVRPKFPCRISYTEQAGNGRLLEMEWEELLPELQLPW